MNEVTLSCSSLILFSLFLSLFLMMKWSLHTIDNVACTLYR